MNPLIKRPNPGLRRVVKGRVSVASRRNLSSTKNVLELYKANLDLATQKRAQIDYLIQKAKSQKKVNWDRLDKLVSARKENIETIKQMEGLIKGLEKK